jgi:hypothetical protein
VCGHDHLRPLREGLQQFRNERQGPRVQAPLGLVEADERRRVRVQTEGRDEKETQCPLGYVREGESFAEPFLFEHPDHRPLPAVGSCRHRAEGGQSRSEKP